MKNKGFTLIEILIVVGILAVLIGAVVVAINPLRQLSEANNTARWAGITTIMNAVFQNIIDNGGNWTCASGDLPSSTTTMAATGGYDVCPCIVTSDPSYLGDMPVDPVSGTKADPAGSCTGYDTDYEISQNATTGRITISASHPQLNEQITLTR